MIDGRKVVILVCAIIMFITMKEVLISNSELLKVVRADAFNVRVLSFTNGDLYNVAECAYDGKKIKVTTTLDYSNKIGRYVKVCELHKNEYTDGTCKYLSHWVNKKIFIFSWLVGTVIIAICLFKIMKKKEPINEG